MIDVNAIPLTDLMEQYPPEPDEHWPAYMCRVAALMGDVAPLAAVGRSLKAEMKPKLEFKEGDTLIAVGDGWYRTFQGLRCVVGKVTDTTVELMWNKSPYSFRYERRFVEGCVSDQRFKRA